MSTENRRLWEANASWWIENFTEGVDPEYEDQIIPLLKAEASGRRRVLDIGCGEGQLSRVIAGMGCEVVGVEVTSAQLVSARQRGSSTDYIQASSDRLPFAGESFDTVVVCLVFEHVDLLAESIAEIARVLEPGGRFCFFLNHPLLQTPGSGWIDDHIIDPPEQYWRIGAYLVETESIEEVQPGVHIRFVHRPLSVYVNTLSRHGLTIEAMVEPQPPESFLARAPEYRLAHTVPRLLYLRMRKS
ncbi:MAG: class I SAM-dependent methyltransferase [Planctomycetes bacterium]|nr:class I SAM-dependent methyltransferase [Actinomycetota bacterium]MBM4076263.1 class I SAM-dependent methyltransferase [Planctomycetota bacterium]